MKNKKNWQGILIAIILVIAIAAAVFIVLGRVDDKKAEKAETAAEIPEETQGASESESSREKVTGKNITYKGKNYTYNSDIRNILFLGIDKKEKMQIQEYEGRGGQSDCIILLSLNTKDKTAFMLNISRDSMTDIDIYGANGDYVASEEAQIALQYAYGDGEKKSCWLTKKAVANLLNDIPIHSYLALNIDGISTINDALGGVEITIPEDYTLIDPAFVKGETLTLSGSQAERYVRYRDINELGSNNGRMVRQNQFLRALVSLLKEKINESTAYVDALLTAGKPFMTTDMTVDEMKELASYDLDEEFIKVPGESRKGTEHDEYVVNYDMLNELLVKLFYKED